MNTQTSMIEVAVLGAGCFWCTEAIYERLKGVIEVVPGYTGGTVDNPTYEQVCFGNTGHIEVAKITFDPTIISYADLLHVFWKLHDPTSLDKQGNDKGSQYRSAIFYTTDVQKEIAEKSMSELINSHMYEKDIVTKVLPLNNFYIAEDYHQKYYENNPNNLYCQFVIDPKLNKLNQEFKPLLK